MFWYLDKNLNPRFYDATEGPVLVDGIDVREYKQSALRGKIAVVLQKSELFSMSVRENIAWRDPDAEEERVRKVAVICGTLCGMYAPSLQSSATDMIAGTKTRKFSCQWIDLCWGDLRFYRLCQAV